MKRLITRARLLACTALAAVAISSPAHADPISAAIVTYIGVTGTVAAVATFAINTALYAAGSFLLNKTFGPKTAGSGQERQASVTTIQVGEVPREYVFGRACTAGSLLDGFNYGGQYGTDWECLVIDLASHPIDALEGYWIYDTYHAFSASGVQGWSDGGLDIQFVNATPAGTAPPARFSAGGWASADRCAGETLVWFAYSAKFVEAQGGRPQPRFVVRGKKLYDPRKDSTVPGGSGSHRWATPSTHEWSENLAVARYNWVRGIYAGDQVSSPQHLWVGRGLSAVEAPPERIFAAANVCDELVALKAGGTQKRYTGGGVIRADEDYATTEEMFAAAMSGEIVQREGGVEIEPGAAKAVVMEITDADLIVGEKVTFENFLGDPQRINTIAARYTEPAQRWNDHAAPVRRSVADIIADGRPKEEPLALSFVTRGPHAQRCAEQRRRTNRMERRAGITLGPRFAALEEGDWIGWTSDRYHQGGRVVYRIDRYGRAASWRKTLALREIASNAYSWDAAADEITPGAELPPEPPAPDPLTLANVVIQGVDKGGLPGVRVTYATPVDPAVEGVRLEIRQLGQAEATPTMTRDLSGRIETTNGVPSGETIQVRLLPMSAPHRTIATVPWTTITSGELVAGAVLNQGVLATLDQADWATHVTGIGKPQDYATKSIVYRQMLAPSGGLSTNDIWYQTNASGVPQAVYAWNGTTWIKGADITAYNIAAGFTGQKALATQDVADWASQITGVAKPENSATKSYVYRSTSAPSSPGVNDVWIKVDGSGNPISVSAWNGTAWITGADLTALNISAGIIGQGPGATDQRDPDLIGKEFPHEAKVSVIEFTTSELASGKLTLSAFANSVPPGDSSPTGRVRLTRTGGSTTPYIQLNMAAFGFPGGVLGRDLTSVQGNFRSGTPGAPIATQWRGLCRAFSSSFAGGSKDLLVSFPVNKDGSTSMGSRYRVCEFDWFGDDEYEQALITAIRIYPLPTTGLNVIDLGWISAGSRVPDALRLRGVADNSDPTALNISAGFTGQAPAATDVTIQPGAGSIIQGRETTNSSPQDYRDALVLGGSGAIYERKTPSSLGNTFASADVASIVVTEIAAGGTSGSWPGVTQTMRTPTKGTHQRRGATATSWSAWTRFFGDDIRPAFGGDLLETAGGTLASLPNFKTLLGISAGFTGQGALATLNQIRASQSALGDTANSWVDPDMEDQTTYTQGNSNSAGKWHFEPNDYTAGKNLIMVGSGAVETALVYAMSPPTRIGAGEIGWFGAAGGSYGVGVNCQARLGVFWYTTDDGSGSPISSTSTQVWIDDTTTGRNVVKGKLLQPPVGTRSFRFAFIRDADPTSTDYALFNNPTFLRTMRDSRMASRGIASQALMSVSPAQPFTPTNSSGARIVISAFTITGDWIGATSYNGATITGLAYNTLYYIWVLDPIWGGGSVTYVATTSASTYVNNPAYIFLGPCRTLTSGGTGGTVGPTDPYCVQVDMVMHDGRHAGQVQASDDLMLLTDDLTGSRMGVVQGAKLAHAPCIHIETESGAWIVVSETTPLTGPNGDVVGAADAWVGRLIAVEDSDGFRWEPIATLRPVGEKMVAHISAEGGTYAAGGEPGRMIFTHNIQWKP